MICPSCRAENDDAAEVCFNCRHVLAAVTRGTVLANRYEVLSTLGKGGMGIVYKARDRILDELVAIKLLRADVAQEPDIARRFRSEIKLARKVSHKNVCRIHEYGEEQALRYICMEYIDGVDLKQVVRERGGLPPREAFDVAVQLAQGLEAIHEVGIVHRDLKTTNVMRDSRGLVRLMDFGIAKQTGGDATTGATATGQVVGTPEYMSPEQARGQKVDLRTDIYALGVVIYEIFTGRVPFKGETPVATLFMHVQDPPPLEGAGAERIPTPLVPVLRKALAKSPRDRFATAKEMAEALLPAQAAWAAMAPTAVSPPTAAGPPEVGATPTAPLATPTPAGSPTPGPTLSPTQLAGRRTRTMGLPQPHPRTSVAPGRWLWVVASAVVVGVGSVFFLRSGLGPEDAPPTSLAAVPTLPPATIEAPPVAPVVESPGPVRRRIGAPAASPPPLARVTAPVEPRATSSPAGAAVRATPMPGPSPTRVLASPATKPAAGPGVTPPPAALATPMVPSPSPEPIAPTLAAPPTPAPAPVPAVATPSPTAAPVLDERGFLQLVVVPFAEVTIDEKEAGRVTSSKLPLAPGAHVVILNHPDYQPLRRKITIVPGETLKLVVDMAEEAVRRKK